MTPEEAEQALQAWATIERDELVRAAHDAGVNKNRIHALTGIARTTIDRILEAPVQTQHDRLVDYLNGYTEKWPHRLLPQHAYFARHPAYSPAMASAYTAQQIADELFADAKFKALKLGTFLNTPDGQMLAAAVAALTPPPYREDFDLLVEALQLAAQKQHDSAVDAVRKGVAVAFGVGALVAIASGAGAGS